MNANTPHCDELRCNDCGGTILPRSGAGTTRGSCHCPRGPGRVVARLWHSTGTTEAYREYAIEWDDELIAVVPSTLTAADAALNRLRTQRNMETASQ